MSPYLGRADFVYKDVTFHSSTCPLVRSHSIVCPMLVVKFYIQGETSMQLLLWVKKKQGLRII